MNAQLSSHQFHIGRIRSELKAAGIPHYGLYHFTSHHLPYIIHKDEHIKAAVYGHHKKLEGLLGLVSGMLIATDKRILFTDHRPGYTTMDELSYDVVSGVNVTTTPFYASVTLFTKIGNYRLSFTNPDCAEQFASYVEERTVSQPLAMKP